MNEKKIECACGQDFEEIILKKHIRTCSIFLKKFKIFDYKIAELLQQYLYDKKNLLLVRFLFKRYIKKIDNKIKKYQKEKKEKRGYTSEDEETITQEESKTPEETKTQEEIITKNPIYKNGEKIVINQHNQIRLLNINNDINNIQENKLTKSSIENINNLANAIRNEQKEKITKEIRNIEQNNFKGINKSFSFKNFFNLFNNEESIKCQFCQNKIKAIGQCENLKCQENYKYSCRKKLNCGHNCLGVNNAQFCLPCLEPNCSKYVGIFNQSKDTCCQICLEKLSTSPIVNLSCNHFVHYFCILNRINEGKNLPGKKLNFNLIKCPVCDLLFECPSVPEIQNKIEKNKKLYIKVKNLIELRLSYEKNKPDGNPFDLYIFFLCYKCKRPYYAGKNDNNDNNSVYGSKEDCLCGKDSYVFDAKGESFCKKHGFKYIEYKCHFCCKIASRFWSQIHFCENCYAKYARRNIFENEKCPIKECNRFMCEFGGIHAPNGIEYCLGCFLCRLENIKNEYPNFSD